MASNKRNRPIASFKQSIPVEVFQPKLKLLPSFRYLDVDALSRAASAEVAIGEVDGGCCAHTVSAVVRNGKVVGIRTEACSDGEGPAPTREHRKLVSQAMKRVAARRRGKNKLPMPVHTFFGSRAVALETSVDVLVCVRICILGFCTTCCRVVTRPGSDITCGVVTIDTTKTGLLSR